VRAGFPLARLGAALACSLAAHAAAGWWLGGLLAPPANAAGGGGERLQARLISAAGERTPSPAPGPAGSAAPGRDAKKPAPVPATRYLEAVELDVRPQIMTRVMPEYPEEVLSGTRGRVVLELYIAEDGYVDRARVALAEPAGKFDAAALKAFAGARFTPGVKAGKPVASRLAIEITFGD
jgi:protein TonB